MSNETLNYEKQVIKKDKDIKNKHVLYLRTRGIGADSVTAFFYVTIYVVKGLYFKMKAKIYNKKRNNLENAGKE